MSQGRSSKASHIQTPPLLHLNRLSFLAFRKRKAAWELSKGGLPLCSEQSRNRGLLIQPPYFVRIGEKGSATFYAPIREALLCPVECPFAFSTQSKRTHIANAESGPGPLSCVVFASLRRHEMSRWPG